MLAEIDIIVTNEDNSWLMPPFTLQEIKKTTFDSPSFKASRSDGFPSDFFQKCWDFMGSDLLKMAESFRKKGQFVKELNNMVIALILKKHEGPFESWI